MRAACFNGKYFIFRIDLFNYLRYGKSALESRTSKRTATYFKPFFLGICSSGKNNCTYNT